MKTFEIEITRDEIAGKVALATACVGSHREEAGSCGAAFMKIAVCNGDTLLLSRLLSDAVAVAADRLRDFLRESLYDGNRLRLVIETSGACGTSSLREVGDAVSQYLAAAVTARWLRMAAPGEAQPWESDASAKLDSLQRLLCHRTKPTRRK